MGEGCGGLHSEELAHRKRGDVRVAELVAGGEGADRGGCLGRKPESDAAKLGAVLGGVARCRRWPRCGRLTLDAVASRCTKASAAAGGGRTAIVGFLLLGFLLAGMGFDSEHGGKLVDE